MKALTYKQYRTVNIILLTLIFVIAESAVTLGANLWFRELPYVLSLAVLFTSLEMMRWRGFGAIAAVVSGIVFCAASGASPRQYLIYCAGNLAMLAALVFLKKAGYGKVRSSALLSIGYVLIVFILAQAGRWAVSTALGEDPKLIVQFVTTDSLSALFAIIAILILRNSDGIFEEQKSYLMRLEEERKAKDEHSEDQYRH